MKRAFWALLIVTAIPFNSSAEDSNAVPWANKLFVSIGR
jgi:hypothetical protein